MPVLQDPLPPAGPERARAAIALQDETRATRAGVAKILLLCPGNWPARGGRRCAGSATLTGAARALPYAIPAGRAQTLRFALTAKTLRKLRRARRMTARVATSNSAPGGATPARVSVTVRASR